MELVSRGYRSAERVPQRAEVLLAQRAHVAVPRQRAEHAARRARALCQQRTAARARAHLALRLQALCGTRHR